MKLASLVFIIFVGLVTLKYTKVYDAGPIIILGTFAVWFIILYIKIHFSNKDKRTPKPVYLTN